jgi:hypothetical protein
MKLIFHIPEKNPKTFSVDKETVTIGRDEACDVVLPYAGFSRKHAQIDLINEEIYITDLGSTNGVFIDGERIPPYEKTKTQSYLSLQIGPATTVEIETAEMPVVNKKAETTQTNTKLQPPTENTRTIVLDISMLKGGAKKKEPPKKEFPKNAIVVSLAIVLMVAGLFYFSKQEAVVSVDTHLVEVAPADSNPLTETEFLAKTVLDSIYKNASCDSDKAEWCEAGSIQAANKEGVVTESKTLVVYLNMDSAINELHGEVFNQMDEAKRLEILALKRVFYSKLVATFIRQQKLDTLQVVIGNIKEDQYSAFAVFKFKRDLAPEKIEKFHILGLFDQVLNEGNQDALIDISLVYDKMAL